MVIDEKEEKIYLTPTEVVKFQINPFFYKHRYDVYYAIKMGFLETKKTEKGYMVVFPLTDEIRKKANIKPKPSKTKISVNFQLYKALLGNAERRGMFLDEYINYVLETINKNIDFFVMELEQGKKNSNPYWIDANSEIIDNLEKAFKKILNKRKRNHNLIVSLIITTIWQAIEVTQKESLSSKN